MIISNSADCPSSSSCSVSIGTLKVGCLEISVTFNVLLLVCCFFRWVGLREEITHHGGMGSEIDPAEDRTNSDLNDSIIDDVEWVEDKLWETNTLESSVNRLVKDLSIPQVEPVKEVEGYKKQLVMEAVPFMKVEGYEVYEGTLDDRLLAVKKILLSENSLEIAKNEKRIHYACEDNSSNIMRLYDFDVTGDSFIYMYFQRWECTFGDLIRFCSTGTTSSSLLEKQKSYLNKFWEENTLWESSGPSNLLRVLIRQLCIGVADLHSHGILHRNINADSFFIVSNEKGITVKLGGFSMAKLREGKALVDQNQFAPEQTHKKNKVEGLTNDIFFLGCLVGFSLARGHGIYQNDFGLLASDRTYNEKAMDIVKQDPEAHYLVKNLTRFPPEHRLTAETALAQPFFWSCQKKVQFCNLASTRFMGFEDEKFKSSANLKPPIVWQGKDWSTKLDGALKNKITEDRPKLQSPYKTDKFFDLVRFMRNTLSHRRTNSEAVKEIVGMSQNSVFEYFTKKFPQLLVKVHSLVFDKFRKEEDFVIYFTDKGTF